MNARDEGGAIDERDLELLAQIERMGIEQSDAEITSLAGFGSRLAHTIPTADDTFRQQLEARVIAERIRRYDQARARWRFWASRRLARPLITAAGVLTALAIIAVVLIPGAWMTAPTVTTVPATAPPAGPASAAIPAATVQPTTAPTAPVIQPTAALPPAKPITPLQTSQLEVGVVTHLYYTDRERVLTLTSIAGFDWVRQQVVWKDVEGPQPGNYIWKEVDNIVNDVAAHNLKLLVNVVQAPSFYTADGRHGLPKDPRRFGDFVEAMARRYGDKVAAYEIWNEQNLAGENGGRVTPADAGRYVELLAEAYTRIKAVSPKAFVLAGAASSSGVNDPARAVADIEYYRAMYRYKGGIIRQFFDAQAVHPGGSANPPDTLWPGNPSPAQGWTNDPTFYFRHVENVRHLMVEEGLGDRQIWITEFGWATRNDTPGYEFGNQVSFEQQAAYIVGAIDRAFTEYRDPEGHPWVGVMFLWNMNFSVLRGAEGQPLHEQASFSILNPDWTPRPAFTALQGFLQKLKQEQGRGG